MTDNETLPNTSDGSEQAKPEQAKPEVGDKQARQSKASAPGLPTLRASSGRKPLFRR